MTKSSMKNLMRRVELLPLIIQIVAVLALFCWVLQSLVPKERKESPPAQMAQISADIDPVREFAQWKTSHEHVPHMIFMMPTTSIAYRRGYRYVAVPTEDGKQMQAMGATLVG